MNQNELSPVVAKKINELADKRRELAVMTPDKALKEIFNAPVPEALVQSFPKEDFYFLVKQIGYDDALDLLSIASDAQWEFLVDMDVWKKDVLDEKEITITFERLLAADPKRFTKWITTEQKELFDLYLYRTVDVRIREHDQDPSDFGDDFFTFDDVMYFRVYTDPATDPDRVAAEDMEKFFRTVFSYMLEEDINSLRNHVWEAKFILPAEEEEEAYRSRNVRLAESGFVPFDEAIGIYQPIFPEEFKKKAVRKQKEREPKDLSQLPVPQFFAGLLSENRLFVQALNQIREIAVWQEIQLEFAALSNRFIVADQMTIEDSKELGTVVKKAVGYLDIGLEAIINEYPETTPVSVIEEFSLMDIFRTGYSFVLRLKWAAESFQKESRYPLSFWGERGMGVLGGLLLPRPLLYDENLKEGRLYRDFWGVKDIEGARHELDKLIALKRLFDEIQISLPEAPKWISWKALLMTYFAGYLLGKKEAICPLSETEVRQTLENLFQKTTAEEWTLREDIIERFYVWIGEQKGTITPLIQEIFAKMWREISDLSKWVDPHTVSAKYIPYLISEETV